MSDCLTVRNVPCAACPYRKDAPSGLWHESEYRKLPDYDRPTALQPPGVFLCHDADRDSVMCRGWLEVHGAQERGHELLALRIAAAFREVKIEEFPFPPCGVPLHESGQTACDAGMRDVKRPSRRAGKMGDKLKKKHSELKSR